jgi:DNA-directed RNA polymerase specialized sigma subunit
MTAKEFMNQARDIEPQIRAMTAQVQTLQDLTTRITAGYSDMPKGSGNAQKLEATVTNIIDLEADIIAMIDALVNRKQEILAVIRQLPNALQQTIMILRYVQYYTWDEIAEEITCARSQMFRLHDDALKRIEVFCK